MKDDIKNLIDRIRAHIGSVIVAPTDLVNAKFLVDCLDASYELEKAYFVIDKMGNNCSSSPSHNDVEPEKYIFVYCIFNPLSGTRKSGVLKAADLNEAKEILKNSNFYAYRLDSIKKLEFNDEGICDIYWDYV